MALTAIHPSEHLAEELGALDMSAAELARQINVPTNRVTQMRLKNDSFRRLSLTQCSFDKGIRCDSTIPRKGSR